mgnify:CR=1 FL=1
MGNAIAGEAKILKILFFNGENENSAQADPNIFNLTQKAALLQAASTMDLRIGNNLNQEFQDFLEPGPGKEVLVIQLISAPISAYGIHKPSMVFIYDP